MKTISKTVPTNQVAWLEELNYRDDYGDLKSLIASLQFQGWDPAQPPTVQPIGEDIDAVMLALEAKHAELIERVENPVSGEKSVIITDPLGTKDDDSLDAIEKVGVKYTREAAEMHASRLKAFRLMHCNAKNKVLKPKYIGITGNRRSKALLEAITNAVALGYQDIQLDIPVVATEERYDELDRLMVQAGENNDEGRKPTTDQENLKIARRMIEEFGANQSAVRKRFKAAKGVQLYYLVVMSIYEERQKFGVDFFKKLTTPTKDKDGKVTYEMSISKFPHSWLQGTKTDTFIGPRCDLDYAFEKRQKQAQDKGIEFERPSQDEFVQLVESAAEGVKGVKAMSTTQLRQFGEAHKCEVVQLFTTSILKNDKTVLSKVYDRAEGINFLLNCSDDEYQEIVLKTVEA
jgi:hypothetical protein